MQLDLFYQPRFVAYLEHTRIPPDQVKTHEFIIWVSGHVEDFKKAHGINTLNQHQQEFTDYLFHLNK